MDNTKSTYVPLEPYVPPEFETPSRGVTLKKVSLLILCCVVLTFLSAGVYVLIFSQTPTPSQNVEHALSEAEIHKDLQALTPTSSSIPMSKKELQKILDLLETKASSTQKK